LDQDQAAKMAWVHSKATGSRTHVYWVVYFSTMNRFFSILSFLSPTSFIFSLLVLFLLSPLKEHIHCVLSLRPKTQKPAANHCAGLSPAAEPPYRKPKNPKKYQISNKPLSEPYSTDFEYRLNPETQKSNKILKPPKILDPASVTFF
jgi:hypothetical protein